MITTLEKLGFYVFAEEDFSAEYGELYITNENLLKKNLVLYYNSWTQDDEKEIFNYYEEISVIALDGKNYSNSTSIYYEKRGSDIAIINLLCQTLNLLSAFSGVDLFEVIGDLGQGDHSLYIEGDENDTYIVSDSVDKSEIGKTFTRGDNETEETRMKNRNEAKETLERVILNFK